jgi:hypothetical protein
MAQTAMQHSPRVDYGLRREVLSPMETLAQSVSTMAPTTTPAATILWFARSPAMAHGSRMCWRRWRCCLSRCASAAMPAIQHRRVRCTHTLR